MVGGVAPPTRGRREPASPCPAGGALDLCRAAQTGDDPGSRTVDDHRFSPSRKESVMRRLAVICTSVALFGLAFTGAVWNSQTFAKTKGGCKDTQICCRYLEDGTTELNCMDA